MCKSNKKFTNSALLYAKKVHIIIFFLQKPLQKEESVK